jgi:small GTP-binding protein
MKRVRVVLCGEASVGKSCIIKRFSSGIFSSSMASTIAGAFHATYVRHDGDVIALEIWDTAGSERYHSVIPSFFKNAAAVVICFDLTVRATFEAVGYWLQFTAANAPVDVRRFLVGNKLDLSERAVFSDEASCYSDGHGFVAYAETSAKTGEGVDTLFALLADVPANGVVEAEVKGEVISLDRPGCC